MDIFVFRFHSLIVFRLEEHLLFHRSNYVEATTYPIRISVSFENIYQRELKSGIYGGTIIIYNLSQVKFP